MILNDINDLDESLDKKTSPTLEPDAMRFSSEKWLGYFIENKEACPNIRFPESISMRDDLRLPLIHSLQKFQIGETGEGKHLKRFARIMNDPAYEMCIDRFIREEQHHARVLAQMISSLNGTLLTWHWTDLIFICLRRLLHLKTEIFILLIAEIVGKCFYRVCSAHLENELLSDAFSLIVLDEIGHLEFHCSFLRSQFEKYPVFIRKSILFCWSMIFFAACKVFISDNKEALVALNVSPKEFFKDCWTTFDISAARSLALPLKAKTV